MNIVGSLSAQLVIDNVPGVGKVLITVSNDFVEIYLPSVDKTYNWSCRNKTAVTVFLEQSEDDLILEEFGLSKLTVDVTALTDKVLKALRNLLDDGAIDSELFESMCDVKWERNVSPSNNLKCPFFIDLEDFERTNLASLEVPLTKNKDYQELVGLISVVKNAISQSRHCKCVQKTI